MPPTATRSRRAPLVACGPQGWPSADEACGCVGGCEASWTATHEASQTSVMAEAMCSSAGSLHKALAVRHERRNSRGCCAARRAVFDQRLLASNEQQRLLASSEQQRLLASSEQQRLLASNSNLCWLAASNSQLAARP